MHLVYQDIMILFLHKQYVSKTAPYVILNPDITLEVYSNPDKNMKQLTCNRM